jgi:hypothetical protein
MHADREPETATEQAPAPRGPGALAAPGLAAQLGNRAFARLAAQERVHLARMLGGRPPAGARLLARTPNPSSDEYLRGYRDGRACSDSTPVLVSDQMLEDYSAGYALGHAEADSAHNCAAVSHAPPPPVTLIPPTPPADPIADLDRRFRDAVARGDTAEEEAVLGAYPDDGARRDRLQWLHLEQATALATYLRPRGGSLYALVEARRIEKLGQEYEAAIAAENWVRVVTLLGSYNDTDLTPRAQRIRAVKGDPGVAATNAAAGVLYPDVEHRVRKVLQYVVLQASTEGIARPSDSQPWGAGTAAGSVAVPGGTVNVYETVSSGTGAADFYAFEYRGEQAERTGWLQFISEEIERFDAATGGSSLGYFIGTAFQGTGQPGETIEWSAPGAMHWYLDAISDKFPFYESAVSASPPSGFAAAGTRGSHSTVPSPAANPAGGQTMMVDRPGSVMSEVHAAFSPIHSGGFLGIGGTTTQVRRVEHRVRFVDYLVRGNQVLYVNTMTVTFVYTADPGASGTEAARTNHAGVGRAATKLAAEHYRALLRRFPSWTFYPHD